MIVIKTTIATKKEEALPFLSYVIRQIRLDNGVMTHDEVEKALKAGETIYGSHVRYKLREE